MSHNQLSFLPQSIAGSSTLQILRANNNVISELDMSFRGLVSLRVLNLGHNAISTVDDSIGLCTNLGTLKLEYNHLIALPYTIGKLTSLGTRVRADTALTPSPSYNYSARQPVRTHSCTAIAPHFCAHAAELRLIRRRTSYR